MEKIKVIIVEDVPLELRGTEGILKTEVPEAEIVASCQNEGELWSAVSQHGCPDLVLLDLGLGGSTTVGIDICRRLKHDYSTVKVLIFTGEILDERLWVDALDAGCNGIILKCGEMLTRADVKAAVEGSRLVLNKPILDHIVASFRAMVDAQRMHQEALMNYEIDEYDERFLRHLALGYTKDQIASLRGMPFGVKSLEKRQMELVQKLFAHEGGPSGTVNATRLVVRAIQLHIIDINNLAPDEQ